MNPIERHQQITRELAVDPHTAAVLTLCETLIALASNVPDPPKTVVTETTGKLKVTVNGNEQVLDVPVKMSQVQAPVW